MSRLVTSILLGVAVSAALSVLLYLAMPEPGVPRTIWYHGLNTIGQALLAITPGFAAGWIAGRSGAVVGAMVAVIVSVGSLIAIRLMWGQLPVPLAIRTLLFGMVASVITQSVAGLAGEFVRAKRSPPPNKSFKPNPLRGSA